MQQLVESATGINSDVNGTLVNMKFKGTNQFFYPTSLVNSYKYPITEQKYFIKAPSNLHIDLESSEVDKIASFSSERWYKITSTEEDIKGNIIDASITVRFGDVLRKINELFYSNTAWIIFLLYLIIVLIPLLYYHYRVDEQLTKGEIIVTIVLFIIAGLLLSAITMVFKRKWKFAVVLFLLWLFLLILLLII